MEDKKLEIKVDQSVSYQDLSDLLISALEGGSNYWYRIERYVEPDEFTFLAGQSLEEAKKYRHSTYPFNPGGALVISDFYGADGMEDAMTTKKLDLDAIKVGCQLMAEKSVKHWANFIEGNADAETGDIFLQYCIFGTIVYG
jgi:hypothetical protein